MATMALRDVTNRMVKNYLKKNYWASPPESENDESEETDYGTEPSMYTKSDIEENEDEEMREFAEEEKENARLRDANLKAESSRKRMSLPDNAINKPGYIDPETEEKFFYTWQFATRIGVSEKTIRNWAKENLLPCIKKELPQKIRKLFYAPAYLIPEESLHIAQEIKKEKDNKKKHYHSEEGKIPLSSELLTRLEVCRNTLKNYMGKAYKGDKFPTGEKIDSQFYFKPDEVVQFKKLFEKHNIGHGRKADKRK